MVTLCMCVFCHRYDAFLPPGYDLLKAHGKLKDSKGVKESCEKVSSPEMAKDGMRSDGEASEGCGEDMTATEVC